MITKRGIRNRLDWRKRQLEKLDKSYVNFVIGDEEYNEKRPLLLGRIAELEDLLCRTNKE